MSFNPQYKATPTTLIEGQHTTGSVDSTGALRVVGGTGASSNTVQGTAADDAAVVGNPVMAGGKYEATPNTVEDGDASFLKVDANGRLLVTARIQDVSNGEYETVAASQTAQVLGATGAAGDYISGILVVPATASPGNVLLLDNATSITVFTGGASSVSNLVPFFIPLGMISVSGAWKITTGANVSCIGIGNFT